MRADEKLTAFVELESAIRLVGNCVDGFVPLSKLDAVWNRGQGRKLFSRSFLLLFQMCTAKGPPAGDKLNKGKINMKPQNLIHILIGIVCIGLLPQMQAAPQVVPAPDGCYPGFTTAEGCQALQNLTTGAGNTGVGWRSLFSAGASNFNTGVGAGTLVLNTADSNTAVGAAAMLLNTTGTKNTAVGTAALVYNDSGGENVAVGFQALFQNTTIGGNAGIDNTAVGTRALQNNTTGAFNTAIGGDVLNMNTTTHDNTAVGSGAMAISTGANNTAVGRQAGIKLRYREQQCLSRREHERCCGRERPHLYPQYKYHVGKWWRNRHRYRERNHWFAWSRDFLAPLQRGHQADGQLQPGAVCAQASNLPIQEGDRSKPKS